ncbi:MAG: alpha/beta fold hydrolase [Gammaproteobacteria bacterium]|nr:alpha/beta fold hydrolase [Gammaproteobacteria bacterium]
MTGGNAHSALNDFRAAWWLPGGHLQSLRRKFGPGVTVAQEGERLPLEDGDFIDLAWVRPGGEIAPGDPVVFILHGLCGCSESLYVQALQHHLLARGIASVAMNFRGCSGEPNNKARSYHSGVSADADQVFRKLRERLPENFFHCVGYSLGGNVLLKWLAVTRSSNSHKLAMSCRGPSSSSTASSASLPVSRNRRFFAARSCCRRPRK